ncbi:MAG: DUF1836 domain-containing protein [Lachnospiraceae bacterium]|nr:DUF1836 domain-containing protein [Candidatus Colinaster equi]
MTIDTEDLINSILASIDRIDFIKSEDIPDIALYMDQVTTLMSEKLKATTRNPGEDKIMTKTMINNYAKSNLIPAPIKKKYTKEQMLLIIIIYYFKNVMSISDIDAVIRPLIDNYYGKDGDITIEKIYETLRVNVEGLNSSVKDDVSETYKKALGIFSDVEGKDADALSLFSFITLLSMDVYIKRLLIEKLVDGYSESTKNMHDDKKD